MDDKEIFASGIGIKKPWFIDRIELIGEDLEKELHIYLGHSKRTRFSYLGKKYSVYDHQERTWHHLRFFQHQCYIHASVPWVKIDTGEGKLVDVSWSQPGSSFTLLFEKDVLELIKEGMSVVGVSRRLSIGDKRVRRILPVMLVKLYANKQYRKLKNFLWMRQVLVKGIIISQLCVIGLPKK
ncbi:MAG: transposase [Saprospiraceae bacterium]|jgi:transposase